MKHHIGIDLGTTNSAITSFDGETVRHYKSPEQNDVTPSAIYLDQRGNRYVGKRAYDNAARAPENAATLFKRFMGTSTPINFAALDMAMTPEECSAEILKVLYGYLPEEIRNDPETGTVITVPAAFNQMQKDATMSAAELAGLGKVALMQEPVAAVMSVMRHRKGDGVFLVYDLGGGTLDIALAQSISGRVSLLSHGGIAICGGRDFDRLILDSVVKPWLAEHFDLPENFSADKQYNVLRHMATWAAERAKIELSSKDEAIISLDDSELRAKDGAGKDIYLDIVLTRKKYDELIADHVNESIATTRETIEKAGLSPHDIGRIVFVGGPTQYKPLRDKVAFELGIAASTDVNPMMAVSEGAALFAESIDWASHGRGRKSGRGELSAGGSLDLKFNYVARTPDVRAKIVAKISGKTIPGAAFQVDSLNTGWSSGRLELKDGMTVVVPLDKPGENLFKVFVFDGAGGPVGMGQDKLTITRTAAQIDAIPASHTIGIEAKNGNDFVLVRLVNEGDMLPKKGKLTFKANEVLIAGSSNSLRFKLYEGSIPQPVGDNRFIGTFSVDGSDFSDGAIANGADLLVEYEVTDSGNIELQVTVPSIGANFQSRRNFYSRQAGLIDYSDATKQVADDAEIVRSRIDEIAGQISDPKLEEARKRLDSATTSSLEDSGAETSMRAMQDIETAKKLLAQVRKEHLRTIRQIDLGHCVEYFNKRLRELARPNESSSFDNLVSTAKRVMDKDSSDFDAHLRSLRGKNWDIAFRQDWFVIDRFKSHAGAKHMFPDVQQFAKMVGEGTRALEAGDMQRVREVLDMMEGTRVRSGGDETMLSDSNISVG